MSLWSEITTKKGTKIKRTKGSLGGQGAWIHIFTTRDNNGLINWWSEITTKKGTKIKRTKGSLGGKKGRTLTDFTYSKDRGSNAA